VLHPNTDFVICHVSLFVAFVQSYDQKYDDDDDYDAELDVDWIHLWIGFDWIGWDDCDPILTW